jgi:hypothetical protein
LGKIIIGSNLAGPEPNRKPSKIRKLRFSRMLRNVVNNEWNTLFSFKMEAVREKKVKQFHL